MTNENSKLWGDKFVGNDELAKSVEQALHEKALKTNFRPLDDRDFVFYPKELTLLAGYTGEGKTTITLQIALMVAQHNANARVGYLSLEISETENEVKILALQNHLSIKDIYEQKITNWKVNNATYQFWNPCLSRFHLSTEKMNVFKIRQLIIEYKLNVVFIDYLSLIQDKNYRASSYDNYGTQEVIIAELKALANELNIAILVIAQLRKPDGIMKRPNLYDIRGASAIVCTVDNIYSIWRGNDKMRESVYDKIPNLPMSVDLNFLVVNKIRRYSQDKSLEKTLFFETKTSQLVEWDQMQQKIIYQHEKGNTNDK